MIVLKFVFYLLFQPIAGNNTQHCREVDIRSNYASPRNELELRCKEKIDISITGGWRRVIQKITADRAREEDDR